MINNVVLVGRIVEEPTLKKFESDLRGTFITLAVSRPFKNYDNQIETDFIRVAVWEGMADNVCAYCHKGDLIGVRGRIASRSLEVKLKESTDFIKINALDIIGERIAFLSSAKKKTEFDDSAEFNDIDKKEA